MPGRNYRYVISVFGSDGSDLGERVIKPDFEPAREWAWWMGVRRGLLPPDSRPQTVVEPLWHPRHGQPYLEGFRAVARGEGDERAGTDFPLRYFDALARRCARPLVKTGDLEPGQTFRYLVSAYRCGGKACGRRESPFRVESSAPALPVTGSARLADSLADAAAAPTEAAEREDAPAFLPQPLLDEVADLATEQRPRETGGVLIGHLYRDTADPELFCQVTAQVPARHTRSEVARLTFTAETWTAVQSAIDIRARGEIMLGWWHSHCFLSQRCEDCERRSEGTCEVSAAFMSADDVALHRTVFPRAYCLALVVADTPCGGLEHALFGWRRGMVAPRAYHLRVADDMKTATAGASEDGR